MRRQRKTKIIATLGPASSSKDMIRQLVEAGADVFRLNMSHSSHADTAERMRFIREVEKETARPLGVMVDLQGPKLRIGTFKDEAVILTPGDFFRLDMVPTPGDETRVCLPHPEIYKAVREGTELLLDDGRLRLVVTAVGDGALDTEVLVGGKLSNRKGVNVPQAMLPVGPLTEKDHKDLEFALTLDIDWIALSFIQRPEDIRDVREIVGDRALLLAKIEKPVALEHIPDILDLSDGLMVARGDLGVELQVEDVPGVQKRLIRAARAAGKAVVVATQMLESMIKSPLPTRAEVSDVANAIFEGADAVMLSAESAAGDYPVAAVRIMNRVARKVESDPFYHTSMDAETTIPEATTSDAISAAARQVAETLSAKAIVSYTTSGATARRASRQRPSVPILVLTPRLATARQLAIRWGLHCVETEDAHNPKEMVERATAVAESEGFASAGDKIVVTAGVPFGRAGSTNILRVAEIGGPTE
jgi:pyruvate kinase